MRCLRQSLGPSLGLIAIALLCSGCPIDLALGKFYRYGDGDAPHASYQDWHAGGGLFTDGTKLTDGVMAPSPWNWATGDLQQWVGWWYQQPSNGVVEVTIDLGKSKQLTNFQVHAASCSDYLIAYPTQVKFLVSDSETGPFSSVGIVTFPADPVAVPGCNSASSAAASLALPEGQVVTGRFVRAKLTPRSGNHLFVDEIAAVGEPQNPPRLVPPKVNGVQQVYLGAYPTTSDTSGPYGIHEWEDSAQGGKDLATVLQYAQWTAGAGADISYFVNSRMKPTYDGHRRIAQIGWEPKGAYAGFPPSDVLDVKANDYCVGKTGNASFCANLLSANAGQCYTGDLQSMLAPINCFILDTINNGDLDQYISDTLTQMQSAGESVFLRFASEMNGDWSPYGGYRNGGGVESAQKFIAMWRRVYSIAEKVGASNLVFVWAPGGVSYPTQSWNDFKNYYPGDNYADWVGVDFYDTVGDMDAVYAQYKGRPFMLAEHGGVPNAAYINAIFDKLESAAFDKVYAITWFNALDWRLDANGVATYAARTANARYISTVSIP